MVLRWNVFRSLIKIPVSQSIVRYRCVLTCVLSSKEISRNWTIYFIKSFILWLFSVKYSAMKCVCETVKVCVKCVSYGIEKKNMFRLPLFRLQNLDSFVMCIVTFTFSGEHCMLIDWHLLNSRYFITFFPCVRKWVLSSYGILFYVNKAF